MWVRGSCSPPLPYPQTLTSEQPHPSFTAFLHHFQLDTKNRPLFYVPSDSGVRTYDRLYGLYRRLHDLFGTRDYAENQFDLMKDLLTIRDEVRHETC
jgi:L-ribulokinase